MVREAVCVSGAEIEEREIMEGDVRDVMLWFTECEWEERGCRKKEAEDGGRAGLVRMLESLC